MCVAVDELLTSYASASADTIGYIVDRPTGYILASSTADVLYVDGSYTKALDSTNTLISSSYGYIVSNGINTNSAHEVGDNTVQYSTYKGAPLDFLDLDIVFVQSESDDDDDDKDSSSSSNDGAFEDWAKDDLVAAVFVLGSLLAAAVVALVIAFVSLQGNAKNKNESSSLNAL
jgi:hypothetical protein